MLDSIKISLQIHNASNEYNCPNASVIRNRVLSHCVTLFTFFWIGSSVHDQLTTVHTFCKLARMTPWRCICLSRSKFSPLHLPSLHLSLSHKHTHSSFTSPVLLLSSLLYKRSQLFPVLQLIFPLSISWTLATDSRGFKGVLKS